MQNASEIFSDWDALQKAEFSVQLPYLNKDGNPICADIDRHSAESLVQRHKTHRILRAAENYFVLTPRIPAAANVVFQIGEEAL